MRWIQKYLNRIRKGILLAEVSDLGEPGLLNAVVEDIQPVLVEDICRSQECYHVKECELMLMDEGWERTRQEMYSSSRCARVKTLKTL